jgi:type III pantothenate kinase
MNLIVDIGNTFTKVAIMEGNLMQSYLRIDTPDYDKIAVFLSEYPDLKAGIISSVNEDPMGFAEKLNLEIQWLIFDNQTAIPFKNLYSTPATLGKDRLAGIAAAYEMFRGRNVLVVDAGSAITYDLINFHGEYLGGAISPGIQMRYKALNTFTGRLPLLDSKDETTLLGDSTFNSIHSGVMYGVIFEVEGFIKKYEDSFSPLTIILTGGDYKYFDKQLKVKTFAAPNLVLEGLNLILNHNLGDRKK